MPFSIETIAKDYIYRRYPNASVPEKEKYVRDWSDKLEASKALVKDFGKRAVDPKGKRILDAGCGNGGVSIAFFLAGARPLSVEVEDELYRIAKEHIESFGFKPDMLLYNGFHLPLSDNIFDGAISVSVLEHTTDPVLYLSEILRTVKPSSVLYLAYPNKLWPKETHTGLWFLTYLPAFLRPAVINIFRRNPLPENNLHFYGYFDLWRMISGMSSNGFSWHIVEEKGETTNPFKKIIKGILDFFGLPYKTFLSHVSVVLKKELSHE